WLVDTASGAKTPLMQHDRTTLIAYSGGQFARDGKGIYITTDKDSEFHRLAYLDRATGQLTFLTSDIPWDVEAFDLSDAGKLLAFVTNEAGVSVFHLLDAAAGKEQAAPKIPGGSIHGRRRPRTKRHHG